MQHFRFEEHKYTVLIQHVLRSDTRLPVPYISMLKRLVSSWQEWHSTLYIVVSKYVTNKTVSLLTVTSDFLQKEWVISADQNNAIELWVNIRTNPWTRAKFPGGGGISRNVWWGVKQAMKKLTQQDLRFCKNEGSKRSKNCKKGCQYDRKSRRKLVQMLQSGQMTDFCANFDQI